MSNLPSPSFVRKDDNHNLMAQKILRRFPVGCDFAHPESSLNERRLGPRIADFA
jgi:hypothetical protein